MNNYPTSLHNTLKQHVMIIVMNTGYDYCLGDRPAGETPAVQTSGRHRPASSHPCIQVSLRRALHLYVWQQSQECSLLRQIH